MGRQPQCPWLWMGHQHLAPPLLLLPLPLLLLPGQRLRRQ
jgi:hypothetical protein